MWFSHAPDESMRSLRLAAFAIASLLTSGGASAGYTGKVISFQSGDRVLHGVIYMPAGPGPFPAILFNHGSAPGMLSKEAFDVLGPAFAEHGWVFFGPYRRGQGLSASAGPYIGDQITKAKESGGISAGATTMVHLLETDHLSDQLSGLAWLKRQSFVRSGRIAVAGNSFGGVEAVLGAERGSYCAAVDSAGGAQSWSMAPELQALMTRAAVNSRIPVSQLRILRWSSSTRRCRMAHPSRSGRDTSNNRWRGPKGR
jgi:carboxymethylenebutenolidase